MARFYIQRMQTSYNTCRYHKVNSSNHRCNWNIHCFTLQHSPRCRGLTIATLFQLCDICQAYRDQIVGDASCQTNLYHSLRESSLQGKLPEHPLATGNLQITSRRECTSDVLLHTDRNRTAHGPTSPISDAAKPNIASRPAKTSRLRVKAGTKGSTSFAFLSVRDFFCSTQTCMQRDAKLEHRLKPKFKYRLSTSNFRRKFAKRGLLSRYKAGDGNKTASFIFIPHSWSYFW